MDREEVRQYRLIRMPAILGRKAMSGLLETNSNSIGTYRLYTKRPIPNGTYSVLADLSYRGKL